MTIDPARVPASLHVGAVVYCRDVVPPHGGANQAKDRRVIILQQPTDQDSCFRGIVTATLRKEVDNSREVQIPHRAGGHPQTTFTDPTVAVLCWRHAFTMDDVLLDWKKGRVDSALVSFINEKIQAFDQLEFPEKPGK